MAESSYRKMLTFAHIGSFRNLNPRVERPMQTVAARTHQTCSVCQPGSNPPRRYYGVPLPERGNSRVALLRPVLTFDRLPRSALRPSEGQPPILWTGSASVGSRE